MIKKINKEIEKLEISKDKKEKEKANLISDLSDIDMRLKELKTLKKRYETLEKDLNSVFNPVQVTPADNNKEE